MKTMLLALLASMVTHSAFAAPSYGKTYPRPFEVCTGTKVITGDGYPAVVAGLYNNGRTAEVQIRGVRGTDTYNIDNLAIANSGFCVDRGAICIGQIVIADGYRAKIVGLFLDGREAFIDYGGQYFERYSLSQLAFEDVCVRSRRCHGRSALIPK